MYKRCNSILRRALNLVDLSVYRGPMMGYAIFIIVFYHFCNRGGTTNVDKLFRFVFSQGYVGVDIFMVMSGLGLTYSLLKNENLREYYIKRWVRIFPFFTFITLIECWLIQGEDLGVALLRSTTIGYWFDLPYIDWYVPAIVGLYVVFPFIFHWIVKPRRYWIALIVGIICLITAIFVSTYEFLNWQHLCFLYRIPDFLMGCMAAVAIKNGYREKVVIWYVFLSVIVGIAIFVTKLGGAHYRWFTNLCFTPLYLSVLAQVFGRLSDITWGKVVVAPCGFIGLFTLELYRISSSFERLLTNESCPENHLFFVILYAMVCLVLSWLAYLLFKQFNQKILDKLLSPKRL